LPGAINARSVTFRSKSFSAGAIERLFFATNVRWRSEITAC